MKEIIISKKYKITAKIEEVGDDLLVIIAGGDAPHIGAVSAGISGSGVGAVKSEACEEKGVKTYTYPSHRDNYISEPVAKALTEKLKRNVVVLSGIHIDNLPVEQIKEIQDMVPEMTYLIASNQPL